MNVERWTRRTYLGPGLDTASSMRHPGYEKATWAESVEVKAPRVLTRALRSLSSSSMDSSTAASGRSSSSSRRLYKTSSSSSSMMERLHRRVSKDSATNVSPPSSDCSSSSPLEGPLSYASMELIHHGPLKADISLLKARSEYLVLSGQCLVKFASCEAAITAFPQLSQMAMPARQMPPGQGITFARFSPADVRLEVPLSSIVAAFGEDGFNSRFAIEIWWFSPPPRLAYCKAHLLFALSKERDAWLASIHRAYREKQRKNPGMSSIPGNLKARINQLVRDTEGQINVGSQKLVFPVAKRVFGPTQRASGGDEIHDCLDSTSFYLVIGPCMCHLLEVVRAEYSTPSEELRVKALSFGTVTLIRFKASVASHEQRFVISFRLPFDRESRIDLASVQYRRIIEALTKADRILKPMWPQHFQQAIFDIKGLPPPLQLTSGNDLGGLERSLQAYCAAYRVQVPNWKIEWNTHPHPAFRLIPPPGDAYLPLQLLAVFRALRYNSFFKAISFRDVNLAPLTGKLDFPQYGDSVAYRSLNGLSISEDHHEVLLQAPILEQEMHALTFASESLRSIDMTNVLGLHDSNMQQSRMQRDYGSLRKMSSEVLRPVLMLLRRQLCVCHSIFMSGNPISPNDADDLATLLVLDHVHFRRLHLAQCALGDSSLSRLWTGLAGQAHSLESLDTSDNQGTVKFELMQGTLLRLQRITELRMAGNTRIPPEESLFHEAAIGSWRLRDLDLSGIALNDATIEVLAGYLRSEKSQDLEVMRLNNCNLMGWQISRLFREMGQARRMAMHLNGNRLDEGIDDLCRAVACGYGPWSLFVQMIEFSSEENYIKLLRALTVNKTIECLSLAGTSTPDAASSTACEAISEFFAKNTSVRFLDISGYDSKLDEGRLGRDFSRALSGLRVNRRIEHLRVRSQMLNVNIGDLAEAISTNGRLHTVDCEGNDFSLSNFRHLVKHLEGNSTIRYLSAFSEPELRRTIEKTMQSAGQISPTRRPSVMSRLRHDRSQQMAEQPLAEQLRCEWEGAVAALERILKGNREAQQKMDRCSGDWYSMACHRDSDEEKALSTIFGGLARREYESRRSRVSPAGGASTGASAAMVCPSQGVGMKAREEQVEEMAAGGEVTEPDSAVSSEDSASRSTDEASTESASSRPELESPGEKEFGLVGVEERLLDDEESCGADEYEDSDEA